MSPKEPVPVGLEGHFCHQGHTRTLPSPIRGWGMGQIVFKGCSHNDLRLTFRVFCTFDGLHLYSRSIIVNAMYYVIITRRSQSDLDQLLCMVFP